MSDFKTEVCHIFYVIIYYQNLPYIYFLIHIPSLILNDLLVHIVPKKMFVFIIFH